MSRFDSEKTPQRRQWTVGSSAGHSSDEQDSEHRAQAWAALGAALVGLGAVGAGTLATIGSGAHLWGDDVFLAGFAFACLLVALGVYALVGEFIGGLPLPPTRRERHDQREQSSPPTGITARHGIKAQGDIETDGRIEAGHGVEAGGHIRSSTQDDPLIAAITKRKAALAAQGLVNPLAGHFRIEQFAAPLGHDEKGCVSRVVIAPDCAPADGELRTDIKDTLRDALSRSSLETWGSNQVGGEQATTPTAWQRSDPNTGQMATFKRYWGTSIDQGFALWARATLQLPPGYQFGSRVVLVLDVVERSTDADNQSPRLFLSLLQLHEFLHALASTAIDEIGGTVFPLVCEEITPKILGPNFQINFGDRSLETLVQIPDSFERQKDASSSPWAEIRTPEDRDPRDLVVRDAVIREGIQKILRSNGYDRIEDEIAKLPSPTTTPPGAV